MDEPESALSVRGQLQPLAQMNRVVAEGGQFVISAHASILTAFPETGIFRLGEEGISEVQDTATEPDRLTKSFLDGPPGFLRHLLPDADKN